MILPSEAFLAPFSLIKAPQGFTNNKFQNLLNLHEKLNPIERFVSLVVDEAVLSPKLNFDSQGMLIGHAINDTMDEDTNTDVPKVLSNEALANRIICYTVQGIAKEFQHVSNIYSTI